MGGARLFPWFAAGTVRPLLTIFCAGSAKRLWLPLTTYTPLRTVRSDAGAGSLIRALNIKPITPASTRALFARKFHHRIARPSGHMRSRTGNRRLPLRV